ncbi:MAG: hypothetical protein V3S89_04205 [Desulfobacterales bacterium]
MKNLCIIERFSKMGLGLFFLFAAFGFILSGMTVLPIFGFFVALPLLFISCYFFRAHLNENCSIEDATD